MQSRSVAFAVEWGLISEEITVILSAFGVDTRALRSRWTGAATERANTARW